MAGSYGKAAPDANFELATNFLLEIDGIALAAFTNVTPPVFEHAKFDHRTGADPPHMRQHQGLRKSAVITAQTGIPVNGVEDFKEIFEWVKRGSSDRKSGAFIARDKDQNTLFRYNFSGGWGSKFEPDQFDAKSEDGMINYTLEIAIDDFEIE